eukprot:UN15457
MSVGSLSTRSGKSFVAQICSIVFLGGLFLMICGEFIGNALQIPAVGNFAKKMKQNQMQSIMLIFMANFVGGQMLATGAFEVYHEDNLIFSKIQTGGLPQLDQIVMLVEQAITNG